MGLPKRDLYVTYLGDDKTLFFSTWVPPKNKDGEYYHPSEIPIGLDMFIPNVLNIRHDDGPVKVKVVKSDKETGLWLICYDDYFGNETHLHNYKPRFRTDTKYPKVDFDYEDSLCDTMDYTPWSIHVWAEDFGMKAGDGPIPVTLEILP